MSQFISSLAIVFFIFSCSTLPKLSESPERSILASAFLPDEYPAETLVIQRISWDEKKEKYTKGKIVKKIMSNQRNKIGKKNRSTDYNFYGPVAAGKYAIIAVIGKSSDYDASYSMGGRGFTRSVNKEYIFEVKQGGKVYFLGTKKLINVNKTFIHVLDPKIKFEEPQKKDLFRAQDDFARRFEDRLNWANEAEWIFAKYDKTADEVEAEELAKEQEKQQARATRRGKKKKDSLPKQENIEKQDLQEEIEKLKAQLELEKQARKKAESLQSNPKK